MTDKPYHLLWQDTELLHSRYEKSAAALIAVNRSLQKQRPLHGGESEFLSLYSLLETFGDGAFTRVWKDPYAYYWIRMAYELLGVTLKSAQATTPLALEYCRSIGAESTVAALQRHLGDFKRLVLGVAVVSGSPVEFPTPLVASLPLAIPGTCLGLTGDGQLEISGYRDQTLIARLGNTHLRLGLTADDPDNRAAGIQVVHCPTARIDDARVCLQPYLYNLPVLDFRHPVLEAGVGFQQENLDLCMQSLVLIKKHQIQTFHQLAGLLRIVALKPYDPESEVYNVSHSDLPGAFIAMVSGNPYDLADIFIHEYHHNRLFFIEERAPFLEPTAPSLGGESRYFSPWRDDPRPLHGIFHGLYVFIPVCHFWLAVYEEGSADPANLEMAIDRIVRSHIQLRVAIFQLEKFDCFTEFGRSLFLQLKKDVNQLGRMIEKAGLPHNAPFMSFDSGGVPSRVVDCDSSEALTVRDIIAKRLNASKLHSQVRDIRNAVLPGY